MGLIKRGLVLSVFLFSIVGSAQEEQLGETYKLKGAISFAPGFLTENTRTIQLHGLLGFRPNNGRIELRGDGFYFLGSTGDRPRFTINHQLYGGAFYRFGQKRIHPYIGFQPGISYSQASEVGAFDLESGDVVYQKTINPVGSIAGGIDLFSKKIFFMFIETRYIFGKHKSSGFPVFLDELRFSFGLGFHL